MTPEEIAQKADEINQEVSRIPQIGYSNYLLIEAQYKRILHDLLVLTRENAQAITVLAATLNQQK